MNIEKKEIWDFFFFHCFLLFIYLSYLYLFIFLHISSHFFSDHQVSVNQCQLLGKHGKF